MQRLMASRVLMHMLAHASLVSEYFAWRVLWLTTKPTFATAKVGETGFEASDLAPTMYWDGWVAVNPLVYHPDADLSGQQPRKDALLNVLLRRGIGELRDLGERLKDDRLEASSLPFPRRVSSHFHLFLLLAAAGDAVTRQ